MIKSSRLLISSVLFLLVTLVNPMKGHCEEARSVLHDRFSISVFNDYSESDTYHELGNRSVDLTILVSPPPGAIIGSSLPLTGSTNEDSDYETKRNLTGLNLSYNLFTNIAFIKRLQLIGIFAYSDISYIQNSPANDLNIKIKGDGLSYGMGLKGNFSFSHSSIFMSADLRYLVGDDSAIKGTNQSTSANSALRYYGDADWDEIKAKIGIGYEFNIFNDKKLNLSFGPEWSKYDEEFKLTGVANTLSPSVILTTKNEYTRENSYSLWGEADIQLNNSMQGNLNVGLGEGYYNLGIKLTYCF